jgi:GNAT superfamily N-acetyltransferase
MTFTKPIRYDEIVSPRSPSGEDWRWSAWKRMYYDSFPENERMSERYFLRMFDEKANGEADDKHLLIMIEGQGAETKPVGMAYYELERELSIGFLWYLAIRQGIRNKGYGTAFYSELVRRMRDNGTKLLVFEVEIPELAEAKSAEDAEWARRRIAWYRRQGAFVLEGVEYFQEVDTGKPPTRMFLMLHCLVPMDAEQGFSLAKLLFPHTLQQVGPLKLA